MSLALLCTFSRMRNHLGLGRMKRDEIPERILDGVAEILRKSDFLKVSDDGKYWVWFLFFFKFMV